MTIRKHSDYDGYHITVEMGGNPVWNYGDFNMDFKGITYKQAVILRRRMMGCIVDLRKSEAVMRKWK